MIKIFDSFDFPYYSIGEIKERKDTIECVKSKKWPFQIHFPTENSFCRN